MDAQTREHIIEALTDMLNRAPTEDEIQNAQTDTLIMHKVMTKKLAV